MCLISRLVSNERVQFNRHILGQDLIPVFAGFTRARRIRPGGGGGTQEQRGGTAGQGGPLRKKVTIALKLIPYFFCISCQEFPFCHSFNRFYLFVKELPSLWSPLETRHFSELPVN